MASTTRPHDYYEILQVPQDADLQAIKLSWKRLARVKHPDRNQAKNATAEFQLLEEAYSTLSDPKTRQIYDAKHRAYTSTSSAQHSTRQSNRGEGPDRNQSMLSMNELLEKLKMWKTRLRHQGELLRDVRARLKKVESEMTTLHLEVATMEQERAPAQAIWSYLDSFLLGGEGKLEQLKQEKDRSYRDKIAILRIREMEKTRQLKVISVHEANIRSFRQQAFSIEYKIRRLMKEKDLRDQEERMKSAEQMRREGWTYAHWSQAEDRAQGAPSPTKCKHEAWWTQIEGQFRCSCCAEDIQHLVFQCPGCKKIACASCRDELRRKRY